MDLVEILITPKGLRGISVCKVQNKPCCLRGGEGNPRSTNCLCQQPCASTLQQDSDWEERSHHRVIQSTLRQAIHLHCWLYSLRHNANSRPLLQRGHCWVTILSYRSWFCADYRGPMWLCAPWPGDCVGSCIWHLFLLFSTEMLIIKHALEAWLNVTQLPRFWPSHCE